MDSFMQNISKQPSKIGHFMRKFNINVFKHTLNHRRNLITVLLFCSQELFKQTILLLTPLPLLRRLNYPATTEIRTGRFVYLDGLRGLAAVMVYTQHFSLAFNYSGYGIDGHDTIHRLSSLPIVRLYSAGGFAVAIFFLLSSIVLSVKPLQMIYNDDRDGASRVIVSSIFRRGIRLFLPPLVIVVVLFTCARASAFHLEHVVLPHHLFNIESPRHLDSFVQQMRDCLQYITSQLLYPVEEGWMYPVRYSHAQVYGFQLWTISIEFWCSQVLFLVLLATCRLSAFSRYVMEIGIISFALVCRRWDAALFIGGIALAESHFVQRHKKPKHLNWRIQPLAIITFVIGLYLGSFPETDVTTSLEFWPLSSISHFNRLWHAIGAVHIVVALAYLPTLQRFLLWGPVRYIGEISFPLYLVHVPVLTTFGWTSLQVGWDIAQCHSPACYRSTALCTYIAISATVIYMADVFYKAIDAPSVRFAKYIESVLQQPDLKTT